MQPEAPRDHDAYRADIDGLRAVAVIAVVVFHAFPWLVSGGFVGVDVFFVISGFLITSILMRESSQGRFTILGFYKRRILRILPSLMLVLAFVVVAGVAVLPADEVPSLGLNLIGATTFSSNFVLYGEGGYFDIDADRKMLLHLWSLGVEEQYYVVWPLVVMALARARRFAFLGFALLFAASLIAGVLVVVEFRDLSFYMPFLRAWELLGGALIAAWGRDGWGPPAAARRPVEALAGVLDRILPLRLADLASLAGLAAIVWATLVFDGETIFPGWNAVLPVGGAMLLIAAPGGVVGRHLLGRSLPVFLGKVSYPWYLWHWPLFVVARLTVEPARLPEVLGALALVSLGLAWASWRFVEKPFRFGPGGVGKALFLLWLLVAMVAIGVFVRQWGGVRPELPPAIADLAKVKRDFNRDWRRDACFLVQPKAGEGFAPECLAPPGPGPHLLLWGDSHAAALYPGLVAATAGRAARISQLTSAGCPPLLDRDLPKYPFCRALNDRILTMIAASRPDVVVLTSRWNASDGTRRIHGTIAALKAAGIARVVVIGPSPRWRGNLPNLVVDYYAKRNAAMPMRSRFGLHGFEAEAEVKAAMRGGDAPYLSVFEAFCDREGCLTRTGDSFETLTTWDHGHLSVAGATRLMEIALPTLLGETPTPR